MKSRQLQDDHVLHVSVEHELLLCLQKAGIDNNLAQRIIHSKGNQVAERLVSILCGDWPEGLIWEEALQIVSEVHLFGPAQLLAQFGRKVNVPEEGYRIPWSEETMGNPLGEQWQFLYFVPPTIGGWPVTLRNLDKIFPGTKHPKFDREELNRWRVVKPDLLDTRVAPGWHCMVVGATVGWCGHPYEEQISLLPKEYRHPTVGELVVAQFFHYLLNGQYMGSHLWFLTSDSTYVNRHIRVRAGPVDGICLSDLPDDETSLSSGMAAARKLWATEK